MFCISQHFAHSLGKSTHPYYSLLNYLRSEEYSWKKQQTRLLDVPICGNTAWAQPQPLQNETCHSLCFIPVFLCPASLPPSVLFCDSPPIQVPSGVFTCWLEITSSVLLLHSSTIALRLFLSLGTAAVPGEGGSQPGHSHSQCFLAHFTHVVTEKSGSLRYMQITYAHACARGIGRQVITCREEWGFISVPVEGDGPEHPRALEGFNNSS